ncbi:MAG: DegV family protein [Ruminococcaceae bacterium]|nr:DegV family protein [Oscillospiraceae bacterium]
MSYIITCDSTCDLTLDMLRQLNILYSPLSFVMDDKVYVDDFGTTLPADEFFRRIDEGAMPTTTQCSVGQYTALFEQWLEQGDIVHIAFSSGLSGSYNSACIAAAEVMERNPGRKIIVVDSLGASSGYGLLLKYAAEMRDNGASMEELEQWVRDNRLNLHHWFFSTNLKHYRRGGRVSGTAAMIGTVLGICPLLNMNNEGKLIPREKIRPKARVIVEIVERMKQHAQNGAGYNGRCYICHSACIDDAKEVARLVKKAFPKLNGEPQIFNIGTVIGSHTGSGTVALFFMGDERGE